MVLTQETNVTKKQYASMVKKDKAKMKTKMNEPVRSKLEAEKSKALDAMLKVYEKDGQEAVEHLFEKKYKNLGKWMECDACESEEPHINNICCVCWTEADND
jgi:hypothetical protein